MKKTDISLYLPDVIKPYREFKKITEIENDFLNDIWFECENIFLNQFIETLNNYGCSRWEKIIGITCKDTDTIDERRFRIKAKINETLPYTFRRMEQLLETLCSSDGYTAKLYNEEYRLKVTIQLVAKNKFNEVVSLLNRIVPANIIIDVEIKYNDNEKISRYRHIDLKRYKYGEIRELLELG